jgi:GntR family transcriptional regulator
VLIRIDPSSDKPIYTQIVDSVVDDIEGGSLEPGARLPSARDLAGSLKVNMHTILKAYSVLQDQGHVEMRRGRGGVRVSEKSGMQLAVSNLVAAAKREGVGLEQVQTLIAEEWQ